MDLSIVAGKLARQESLTPEDVQLVQAAIQQYGVHNTSKLLDAQARGQQGTIAPTTLPPAQTPAQQEEAALMQSYGTPQRMNQ